MFELGIDSLFIGIAFFLFLGLLLGLSFLIIQILDLFTRNNPRHWLSKLIVAILGDK